MISMKTSNKRKKSIISGERVSTGNSTFKWSVSVSNKRSSIRFSMWQKKNISMKNAAEVSQKGLNSWNI